MVDIYKTILDEWKEKQLNVTISRDITLEPYVLNKSKHITITSGFRRTGKTYLQFSAIRKILQTYNKEQIVYINFEDERLPLKTELLTNLLPAIKKHIGSPRYLFLDELQTIPNWSKWLRRVYDTEPNIRFFVTGSSSKLSDKEIPTELRGRFLELKVYPLSFKEFLRFKNERETPTFNTTTDKANILRLLNEYLTYGGLPEVVLVDQSRKDELLHNYFNTVVRRDIIERFRIRSEETLKALILLLLNSTQYTISKTYNTLKSLNYLVGKTTISAFISYFETSYFLFTLPVFSPKVKDKLQCPRKIYFIDTGFVRLLSNKFSDGQGRLYENLVFLELKRIQQPGEDMHYWKNQQHEEVDFVITKGLQVTQLIQVCHTIEDFETKRRETRALLKASKELACNNLLIITEDKEDNEITQGMKVYYVPLWKWLLAR